MSRAFGLRDTYDPNLFELPPSKASLGCSMMEIRHNSPKFFLILSHSVPFHQYSVGSGYLRFSLWYMFVHFTVRLVNLV